MKKKSPSSMAVETSQEVLPDEIPQEHSQDAPEGWIDVQERLAESLNLSVLIVDGHQPPALALSNNNSICHAFQSSPDHGRLCDPYCGDAHRRAISAGSKVQYKCHDGLECFTMPVQIGRKQNLAAIGGRAFVSVADYRSLVDRFRAGELNDLLNRQPFENVIFAESQRLEQLSQRLDKAARNFGEPGKIQRPTLNIGSPVRTGSVSDQDRSSSPDVETPPANAGGSDISVSTGSIGYQDAGEAQLNPSLGLQVEIDRLRGELEYRTHLAQSLQSFLERISSSDPDKNYSRIARH